MFDAITNLNVILIDEIDVGLNSALLRLIVNSFNDYIKGQVIITSHSLSLLDFKYKNSLYFIIRDDDFNISVESLNAKKREIQAKTDIKGKYLNGKLKGVPETKNFDFETILKLISK